MSFENPFKLLYAEWLKRWSFTLRLIFSCVELVFGLISYFSSDWTNEHTIKISNNGTETTKSMKLYRICDNCEIWQHINSRRRLSCPPIAYEHSFLGMLIVAVVLTALFKFLKENLCLRRLTGFVGFAINIGLITTASFFITSARQSETIIEDVIISSGPYHLRETMKIATGIFVIVFSFVRCILLLVGSLKVLPDAKKDVEEPVSTTDNKNISTGFKMMDLYRPPEYASLKSDNPWAH